MSKPLTDRYSKRDMAALVFLTSAFLLTCLMIVFGARNLLDGDASSELVLANLLSKEGAILSNNWIYSTELRVLNTQLIYAPLFKVFSSWYLVRAVGAIILNALLCASYLFMMQAVPVNRAARLSSAALLFLPLSIAQARIIHLHTYYIPHVAIGFVLIGLMLRYLTKPKEHRGVYPAAFFVLLSFLSGLGGVRQLMITLAPLTVVLLIRSFVNYKQQSAGIVKELRVLVMDGPLVLGGSGLVANLLGIAINHLVLFRHYSFEAYLGTRVDWLSGTQVMIVLNSLLEVFGYTRMGRLLSPVGLLSVGGLLLLLMILGCASFSLVRSLNLQSFEGEGRTEVPRLLWNLFLACFVINGFLFTTTTAGFYALYWLPVFVLIFPLVALMLDRHATPIAKFPSLIALGVVCLFIMGGVHNNIMLIARPKDRLDFRYGGISYSNMHLTDQLRPAVKFLKQSNIRHGYATFWHSNVVREMSNGTLESVAINYPELSYKKWLVEKDKMQPSTDQVASFLLLSKKEYGGASLCMVNGALIPPEDCPPYSNAQVLKPAFEDQEFVVFVFEDDRQIQALLHRHDVAKD